MVISTDRNIVVAGGIDNSSGKDILVFRLMGFIFIWNMIYRECFSCPFPFMGGWEPYLTEKDALFNQGVA